MDPFEQFIESLTLTPSPSQVKEIRKWWDRLSPEERRELKPQNTRRRDRQKRGTYVIDYHRIENRPQGTPYTDRDREVLERSSRRVAIADILEAKAFLEKIGPMDARIRSLVAAGYTQEEIARMLCVHQSTVSRRVSNGRCS